MLQRIRKFLRENKAATAIEYGLIAALVSVAAIGALTTMGGKLKEMFGTVSTELQTAVDSAGSTSSGG